MSDHPTPRSFGFMMPAEWELHEATWLAWPHNPDTWIGFAIEEVESATSKMIAALTGGESVCLLVNDQAMQNRAELCLASERVDLDKIHFLKIPTNDAWIRDYGPNFVSRNTESGGNEVAANIWKFDSWGQKYEYELDSRAAEKIIREIQTRHFSPGIVLEGGAIEVNGRGTVITTRQCLLNPNRNEGLSKNEIEGYLKEYLGATHVIWCEGESVGDDTDGHIDNFVRFTDSNTVVAVVEEDASDPNHSCTQKNFQILKSARDQDGNPLNVIALPTPGRIMMDKDRLPASYANFYIGNQSVLLPVFDHPNDAQAESILSRLFPDRAIVCVPGTVLVSGLGGPHCLTQQQPINFNF